MSVQYLESGIHVDTESKMHHKVVTHRILSNVMPYLVKSFRILWMSLHSTLSVDCQMEEINNCILEPVGLVAQGRKC